MTDSARYTYAVGRGLEEQVPTGLTGLRGAPVELVPHRGLVAVVGDVPLPEFDEDGLRRHLEDLTWLEEVARAHDDVVRACAATGAPVAPMRLATIFHDDDGVRHRIDEAYDALVGALDRVEGRAEWSVKVVVPPADTVPPPTEQPTSGTDFLRRRREQVADQATQQQAATAVAEEVHAEVARVAEDAHLLPPQDPQITGHTGRMVLNGAYLVARADEEALTSLVDELRGRHAGITIECGGPWPPYSFAVLEQS